MSAPRLNVVGINSGLLCCLVGAVGYQAPAWSYCDWD